MTSRTSKKMKRMTEMEPEIEKETKVKRKKTTKKSRSEIDGALLDDILRANGEEYVIQHIFISGYEFAKEKLLVIVGWKNVEEFVRSIQTAREQAEAPGGEQLPVDPFGLPATVTVQNFKEAVLEYVRPQGDIRRFGTTCLSCSLAQLGQVTFMLRDLDHNPWIQRVVAVGVPNVLPIACVYAPRRRTILKELRRNSRVDYGDNTILDRAVPQLPNSLWG